MQALGGGSGRRLYCRLTSFYRKRSPFLVKLACKENQPERGWPLSTDRKSLRCCISCRHCSTRYASRTCMTSVIPYSSHMSKNLPEVFRHMGRFSHTFLLCSSRAIIERLPTFRYYCLMHVYQKWQSRFFDRLRNTHPSWGGYFYGMPDRIRTCDRWLLVRVAGRGRVNCIC